MAMASAPLSWAILANSTALTEFLSQPLRNFTVTGTGLAAFTLRMIRAANSGSFIRALPARLPAILGAGQPMFRSMTSGPAAMAASAARARTSGSSPNSCTAPGRSPGPISSSSRVLALPWRRPLALTISPTV